MAEAATLAVGLSAVCPVPLSPTTGGVLLGGGKGKHPAGDARRTKTPPGQRRSAAVPEPLQKTGRASGGNGGKPEKHNPPGDVRLVERLRNGCPEKSRSAQAGEHGHHQKHLCYPTTGQPRTQPARAVLLWAAWNFPVRSQPRKRHRRQEHFAGKPARSPTGPLVLLLLFARQQQVREQQPASGHPGLLAGPPQSPKAAGRHCEPGRPRLGVAAKAQLAKRGH